MTNKDINDFLCSQHKDGRAGFTDEGFEHYMNILKIIRDKMFSNLEDVYSPECSFVESIVSENWDRAYFVADTRNKEAIEKIDLFRKFLKALKVNTEYRDKKLSKILRPSLK